MEEIDRIIKIIKELTRCEYKQLLDIDRRIDEAIVNRMRDW